MPEGAEAYREHLLDHYRNPRHHGVLEPADVDVTADNPLCGDQLRVTLRVNDGVIADARFTGQGCAISQAAASLFLSTLSGKTTSEVLDLNDETVVNLLGVPVSASRRKCALLAIEAVRDGLS